MQPFDFISEKQKAVFADIANAQKLRAPTRVVLFGTNWLGRTVAERLRAFPVKVECFCDNDASRQGTEVLGHPVLSVTDAVKRYGDTAVFVVCVFHGIAPTNQLIGMGVQAVSSAAALCRHLGPPMTPLLSLDRAGAITSQLDLVAKAGLIWADAESSDCYHEIVRWFMATEECRLPRRHNQEDMYFPPDLWTKNPYESMVDCGAFDGDSVLFLIKKTGGEFDRIFAFEPDPHSFQAMRKNLGAAVPDAVGSKIFPIQKAVGAKHGVMFFDATGTVASKITEEISATSVECVTLDDVFSCVTPTYLKADLEGYEMEMLSGARKLMAEHQPILAITCYHKMEHLWKIPLFIHECQPNYRFYLRRYAEDCFETVCYAIPKSRCLK